MSSSNGQFYTDKSMNGVIVLSDGQGVEISDGNITSATIYTDNIQAINPVDDVYLFTNSTGTIHTGFSTTVNTNNLQGTTVGSNISLYTNTSTGNIDLGTGLLSSATNTIGNAVCKNKIGNVIITDKTFTTPNTSDSVSLYDNIISGNITLGLGGTSGSITIGTTNTTDCFISNLNIRSSEIKARVVSSTCGLFNNLTIGGVCNIASGITTGATAITIGSALTTGFCSIGGGSTTTGGLKLYSPPTMGYSAVPTLASNQIGYKNTIITGGTTLVYNTALNVAQTTLTAGIWILQGNLYYQNQSPVGNIYLSISAASPLAIDFTCMSSTITFSGLNLQVSRIINTAFEGVGPWYLVAQTNANPLPGLTAFMKFNVHRLA